MRRLLPLVVIAVLLLTVSLFIFKTSSTDPQRVALLQNQGEDGDKDMYDGPAERDRHEFEQTKDPALGYIPSERLITAIDFTQNLKNSYATARFGMLWNERGPIFDSVGPSNANTRGGGGYTSGRMRAVLIDTLNDPTGNTIIVGGVAGGIWKTTNFLSATPNWQLADDYFFNLAIGSICQDPTNPSIIYFSTGEPVANADAVVGAGIWKSIDAGNTWSRLPSTATLFGRTFKLQCDAAGNLYVASRSTAAPFVSSSGLFRSNNKGVSFTNITPNNLTSINAICTDIEITSTGRLHASFGYNTGGTSSVNHRYTLNPATVTSTSGWNSGAGIRLSSVSAIRMELTALADTLYAVTVNSAGNIDSCYKSVNGGANWTKQNTTIYTGNLTNTQGWYNLTLAINPANSTQFMVGGLDAYRSSNSGQTISIATNWVSGIPYVHADHHFMSWFYVNGESRIIIGCDGGIYASRNGGVAWQDKNKGLAIKQFYAAAIHPAAGSPYLLAGAQDNGVHQISTPGLTHSKEVTGGDGMFVHINQLNPLIQFGSYTGNQYRRSIDGGQTWAQVNFGGGSFVNPWDYDDAKNIMYASYSVDTVFRWTNANTTNTPVIIGFPGLGRPASFKVSPNTPDRLFVGGTTGKLYRVDKANTYNGTTFATDVKNITGSFPAGFLNCVNVGSTDDFLVAVFSNYGVNNIWYSNNGGTSWAAIDGNLPDMPVRWAMFVPGNDQRMMIATETGVFTTDLINGATTNWETSTSFPTVKTNMLKVRASDNTVVAATHGRGLFTAQFPGSISPIINFASAATNVTEDSSGAIGCRRFKDYTVNLGILNPPAGDATVTLSVQAGNTATPGFDFDFTTNGSFTNPSAQVIFRNGDATVVPVTVRIYDDAEIESTETFTIGFAISGTTNAAKGTTSAHTFTIFDNDYAPVVSAAANVTLGTYDTDLGTTTNTTSDLTGPFSGRRLKHRLQVMFTAAEFKTAGFNTGGPISSMTIRVKTKNTTLPFTGFTVSIGHTGFTGLNTGFVPDPLTTVFSGNYSTVAGNNTFNFVTPFVWDGIRNIVVQFCYDKTATETVTDIVEGNAAPMGAAYRASTYANHTTSTAPGCSIGVAFVSSARLNATFATSVGNNVATLLNTATAEYLNSNNDLYYYSKGEIIARIKNQSAHNYGCTQVTIDRAGTGATQFWNFNPANYAMNKTFRVVPATNNSTGKYEITLYYTKEEKEGWEAATGQSWNNIMLLKVPSAISNVTPLNGQPDGPGTVQIITPVRGAFGTGYTLTATVENGFSGFGAGIPGRIHTVLTLSGQLDNNLKDINLSWTTSAEMGTASFELEKSYDGRIWNSRYSVAASGTKLTSSTYPYVDRDYVQLNYYRVKLLFADGTVQYSNTIFIENNNVPQRMNILGNPFTNYVSVLFSRAPASNVQFELFDMSGRMVARYVQTGGGLLYRVTTTNIASAGIYRLRVYADNIVYYFNVLKQ